MANLHSGILPKYSLMQSESCVVYVVVYDSNPLLVSASEALILRNSTHTGPIRGLDFSPIQTNLLSSGGINGEVYRISIQ